MLGYVHERQSSLAQSSLSQIINARRNPKLDNVEALSEALDTTVSYLIGQTDDPVRKPINNHIRQRRIIYEVSMDERLIALWRGLSAERQRALLELMETMQEKVEGRIIGDAPGEE